MRWLFVVGLLALCAAAPAAARPLGGVESGSYTVLDGPLAGQDVYVGVSGTATVLDAKSDLKVMPADEGCDDPHLAGTLDGKHSPDGGCGFGKVRPLSKLPLLVRDVANAITEEERSIRAVNEGGKVHWELTLYGQLGIEHSLESVDEAEKKGELSSVQAGSIRRKLSPAHSIDEKVKKEQQSGKTATNGDRASWARQLANALSLKREAMAAVVEDYGLLVKRCTDEKVFPVYAIPAGPYTGSYTDVFPHNVPRNAKHIQVAFVDAATGRPVPEEVFPGQTWTSEVKGFKPNGDLDVRVNITGKGFGKPDANSVNWKVIVSFDCT